jgi:hypothetical protein
LIQYTPFYEKTQVLSCCHSGILMVYFSYWNIERSPPWIHS